MNTKAYIDLEILRETDKAFRVRFSEGRRDDSWIPKSLISKRATEYGVIYEIPVWFLVKNNLGVLAHETTRPVILD